MTNYNYENIFNLLKKYNFDTTESLGDDLLCRICRKLIIDARQTQCGCTFCYDCLTAYVNSKHKFCPGNSKSCQKKKLYLDKNIQIAHSINERICQLIVKCPEGSCEYRGPLATIAQHLVNCGKKRQKCLSSSVGSDTTEKNLCEIQDYLVENESHSRLIITSMNNIETEMESLKKELSILRQENTFLRCKSEEHTSIIEANFNGRRTISETNPGNSGENYEEMIEDLEKRQEKLRESISELLLRNFALSAKSSEINEKLSILDKKTRKFENQIPQLESSLEKQIFGEFVWFIEQFSEKRRESQVGSNSAIYSNVFYSHRNGYKMCLEIELSGVFNGENTHLSLFFCLLSGEFDSILQWPFRHNVTFSLFNQSTGLVHKSKTITNEDFPTSPNRNKPTSARNNGLGFAQFIRFDELSNNESLLFGDRIIIKCHVHGFS